MTNIREQLYRMNTSGSQKYVVKTREFETQMNCETCQKGNNIWVLCDLEEGPSDNDVKKTLEEDVSTSGEDGSLFWAVIKLAIKCLKAAEIA